MARPSPAERPVSSPGDDGARREPAPRVRLTIAPSDAPTRALKTSETVARDIVHDIVANGLRTGDSLPHEAAMLEEYGVSRESLREGLRLLEVQGLITIKRGPGGGPVVGQIDPANLGRISTLYYHLAGATYRELFDAWVLMEPILAARAARNDDRALVVEAMEPYVEELDDGAAGDIAAFVGEHVNFHAVIASLAGNRVLELMLPTIGLVVTHHVVVSADPREVQQQIERDHAAIARAVSDGDAKARKRSWRLISSRWPTCTAGAWGSGSRITSNGADGLPLMGSPVSRR